MSRISLDVFDLFLLFYSWYIKPLLYSQGFIFYIQLAFILVTLVIIKLTLASYTVLVKPILYLLTSIKITSMFSVIFSLKFIILIALLIFVRGGIPRYRYDFLTKLGWIKTLSLVLAFFLINLLLSYL